MTMWRIVGGVLLATVLLTTGCDFLFGGSVEPKTPEEHVRSAISALDIKQSVDGVKKDLQQAIDQLPNEGQKKEIREKLTEVKNRLPDNPDDSVRQKAITDLQTLAEKLESLPKPEPAGRPWGRWLMWGLYTLAAVAIVLVLGTTAMYIWKRAWRNVEINVARIVTGHLGAERRAQPDFTDQLTSLSSSQKEIKSNLLDLQTEVSTLARMVRESLADRNDRRPPALPLSYQPQSDGSGLKDEPEFPVSVNEYLGKMSRYANAVKLDFQNGILVNDPDNKDELFLIRDSRDIDDGKPLFLVPGAAQFHNRQDFEIYYSKYYNCPRPQMGEVWIVGPAMVEKVPGGWQLREKGMLDVR